MTTPYPILIVGAGPVGLSLALALTRRGIPVEVFDTLPELSPSDRANTFHPPTLEMMAEWGIADSVIAAAERVDIIQYWERASRRLVAEFTFEMLEDFTPYPFRVHYPQHLYCQQILPLIEASGLATVHFKHRFLKYHDRGDHVEAVFKTPTGDITVQGAYLCGADGGRSTVRDQMNVRFQGRDYPDRFLIVNTDIYPDEVFPQLHKLAYIFDPETWVVVMAMKNLTRFIFRVQPHEEPEVVRTDPMVRNRIETLAAVKGYNIKGVSFYKVQQRTCENFRSGKVVLLGDAAHLTNPIGGMGMNSGIHDAFYLSMALDEVSNGGSESVLDEYAVHRREVAVRQVQRTSDAEYGDMVADDDAELLDRESRFISILNDANLKRRFLLAISMMDERLRNA